MTQWLRFTSQIALLWLIYKLGNIVAETTNFPIPGNVFGMIILFLLMLTGIIQLEWIEEGADLLFKHLAFFFIPIAVGLMQWIGLFKLSGLQLLLSIILGTAVCIMVMGSVATFFVRFRSQKGGC
ncbi:CidA/LrgA family protein [Desulfosporosinus sp. Sb-LF]|uniref:CidA/LrgA family protein n=1 Tax=Desulfosporosinus sp. Sb-LF TaxID=2560027 RepID=UPI00107F2B21|nr:CidA/LrgA family protein [Desulfosporosinus sp. Sb-LF]TGE34335.1 CidA/LrgA family protein [Desulfosporosinus sp. Sb-LF]